MKKILLSMLLVSCTSVCLGATKKEEQKKNEPDELFTRLKSLSDQLNNVVSIGEEFASKFFYLLPDVEVPKVKQNTDEAGQMFTWFRERAKFPLSGLDCERHEYLKNLALNMNTTYYREILKQSKKDTVSTRTAEKVMTQNKQALHKEISSAEDLAAFKGTLSAVINMKTVFGQLNTVLQDMENDQNKFIESCKNS